MIIMYNTFSCMNYTFDETMIAGFIQAAAPQPDGTTIVKNQSTNLMEVSSLLFYQKQEIDAKISSVFKWKGSVATLDDLPSGDSVDTGWVYTVTNPSSNMASAEYGWNGTEWEMIGPTLDLSGYMTITAMAGYLSPITDRITAIENNLINVNTSETLLKFRGVEVFKASDNVKVSGSGINAAYGDNNEVTLTVNRDVQSTGAIGNTDYETSQAYFEAIDSGNFSDDSAIIGSIRADDLPAGLSNAEILIYKLIGEYTTYNAFLFSNSLDDLYFTTWNESKSSVEWRKIIIESELTRILNNYALNEVVTPTWRRLTVVENTDAASTVTIPNTYRACKLTINSVNEHGLVVTCPTLSESVSELKLLVIINDTITADTIDITLGTLTVTFTRDNPAGWPATLFTFFYDGENTRIKQETCIDHLVNYVAET